MDVGWSFAQEMKLHIPGTLGHTFPRCRWGAEVYRGQVSQVRCTGAAAEQYLGAGFLYTLAGLTDSSSQPLP